VHFLQQKLRLGDKHWGRNSLNKSNNFGAMQCTELVCSGGGNVLVNDVAARAHEHYDYYALHFIIYSATKVALTYAPDARQP